MQVSMVTISNLCEVAKITVRSMLKVRHSGQVLAQETQVILRALHTAKAELEAGTSISQDFSALPSGTELLQDTQESKLH